jgi:hypothetical protein
MGTDKSESPDNPTSVSHREEIAAAAKAAQEQSTTLMSLVSEQRVALTSIKEEAKEAIQSHGQLLGLLERAREDAKEMGEQKSRIAAAADKIDENGKTIEERSKHIEESRKHADEVRTHIDKALTDANAQLTVIDGAATSAAVSAQAADTSKTQAEAAYQAAKVEVGMVEFNRDEAKKLLKEIETARNEAAEKIESAEALEKKVKAALAELKAYQDQLKDMQAAFKEAQTKIENLLPGATSAGLATQFSNRAGEHTPTKVVWQWVLFGSLACLLGVAVAEFIAVGKMTTPPSYDELFRRFLERLPIVTPLAIAIWYSIVRAAQARQLEEEYAFKAATAASFDGFAKMMSQVPSQPDKEAPGTTLATNVLRILAASPQRIFHRTHEGELPASAFLSNAAGLPKEVMDRLTEIHGPANPRT